MKIKIIRQKKNLNLPNYIDIIKSRLTQKQINANPELKNSLDKTKNIKFNFLFNERTKFSSPKENISSDSLINNKKKKIILNLGTFQKSFYDFNKKFKKVKIRIEQNAVNNKFSKVYKGIKNNKIFMRKEMLNEIKTLYKKKNVSLPLLQNSTETKNLFNQNLLLLSQNQLKKSITHNFFNEKNNKKSISFLKKLENNLAKEDLKNINPELKEIKEEIEKISRNKSDDNMLIKKQDSANSQEQNLEKSKNEINKINDTINNIEDIDFFFESGNKNYIKYLKGEISKNISKYSTNNKTGFSLFNNPSKTKKANKSYYSFEIKEENKSIDNSLNKKRKTFFELKKNNLTKILYNKSFQRNNTTKINKKIIFNDNFISQKNNSMINLENLYNKIKNNENLSRNKMIINKFLPEKKIKEENSTFLLDIYAKYKNTRNHILRHNFYKTFTTLKKKSGLKEIKNNNIEKKEEENELQFKYIDNKMEDLIELINN